MEITQMQLLSLLGAKEIEIYLLKLKVAELEEALKNLPQKTGACTSNDPD